MTSGVSEACWVIYCYHCSKSNHSQMLYSSQSLAILDHDDLAMTNLSIANLSTNIPTLLLDKKANNH